VTTVLGIDPGSRITGFGLVELVTGSRPRYLASGCIRVESETLPQRLHEIYMGVCSIVNTYSPQEVAIEKVFVKNNVDSALKLGQARGAALVALSSCELAVHEYAPAEIKQAIVGRGNAAKSQIQHMVCALLSLPTPPQADAADALAAALCHAFARGNRTRRAEALAASEASA